MRQRLARVGNKTWRRTMALICAVVALGLGACKQKTDLPQELVGTYTTTDASYVDRYFTLTPIQVVLGLGEERSERGDVKAVYEGIEQGRQVYSVVYRTTYGDDSLSFYTEGSRTNVRIVLKNRPDVVWTRGESRQ